MTNEIAETKFIGVENANPKRCQQTQLARNVVVKCRRNQLSKA